ncbi:uncharacterized protein LOC126801706 isoform X6 [Argentina anserina]|uniref:uncharacterized protein LOC126801706 isoform X6 n=1 Tax=Argentina anserina TaxID=57926 RepID=UPI00217661A0|nr:uncharacterized protein LOC126801706 isoform X6 [Potentilla anserina]
MSFCDHDNLRGPTENPMGPQVVPFLRPGGGQQVQRRHITDNPPYFSSAVGPEEVERHHAKDREMVAGLHWLFGVDSYREASVRKVDV